MTIKYKHITRLGLAAAFIGSATLVACSDKPKDDAAETKTGIEQSTTPHEMDKGGEGGEGGEAGHAMDMDVLPLPKRLAFMAGHVEAGLSLYRAGEPKMASKHLLHPVSETHAKERAGIDKLGFKGGIFEKVSRALDQGQAAADIEPQLIAAEKNLDAVRAKAGGDPVEILNFLMNTIIDEYSIGVTDGTVTDAGEYQDAWGFAIVARKTAKDMPEIVKTDIETLIKLWPVSPIPPAHPAPVAQVTALVSKIQLNLPKN
ncbi:MAG: hypothetical protein COA43_14300 [Robiginitomaculum sp.]|nr:MAG: hypothetical protein COA43_14300 [Robiginitomaculum sp.]